MTDHSAALDAVECLRGRERAVEELSGGLTNVNLKVTTDDASVVVRIAQAGSELLAIDREAEYENSKAAAEAGVGAPVLEYVPDHAGRRPGRALLSGPSRILPPRPAPGEGEVGTTLGPGPKLEP